MSPDAGTLQIPLDGYEMHLRPSELESVATGLGDFQPVDLANAVRSLPVRDRAPLWELATRRFGRGKLLEQAAGEIGMDASHARALLESLGAALARPTA